MKAEWIEILGKAEIINQRLQFYVRQTSALNGSQLIFYSSFVRGALNIHLVSSFYYAFLCYAMEIRHFMHSGGGSLPISFLLLEQQQVNPSAREKGTFAASAKPNNADMQ